jgi:hypothetical protein
VSDGADEQKADPAQTPPRFEEGQFAIPIAFLLPLVLASASAVAVYLSDGIYTLPVQSFYGTAAQIIPILIVAFALENRAVAFLSDPRARIYRAQLFLFLAAGELFALLGASGALRGDISAASRDFAVGEVAASIPLSNVIAAGTAAGLVGGFTMIAVLALGGPGWILVSRPKKDSSA